MPDPPAQPSPRPAGPASSTPAPESVWTRVRIALQRFLLLREARPLPFRELFRDVLRRHSEDEVEETFATGTRSSTPALEAVVGRMPRPWIFGRVLVLSLLAYAGLLYCVLSLGAVLLVPGLMVVGAFVTPSALIVLFYELNTPRNVSAYQLVKLLAIGGVLSLIVSLQGFEATDIADWIGPMSAGIVEELGKLLALFVVVRNPRYTWTLNGLLFGAIVGAGFAALESAGYAFVAGERAGIDAMVDSLTLRGTLTLCGAHIAWTGLVGAALWRVKGTDPFRAEHLADPRFWRVLLFAMGLHILWNSPLDLPFYGKFVILGLAAWFAVVGFVREGVFEVEDRLLGPAGAPPGGSP